MFLDPWGSPLFGKLHDTGGPARGRAPRVPFVGETDLAAEQHRYEDLIASAEAEETTTSA